ncbi:hypothetical protein FO440_15190 [Mucilaginibacter corticis]|uniref:Uncharacterized protein n=1 Tax=Mucilaginibacter corticis TaxID=2597670 RepID=A0A556MMN0_9SPHI|nr:hypothetical protein [Mucilaginibacter corticis]TSJ41072.1 hypothetical protein FO440_15190 [Mucilaginibacter corticis]
MKKKNTFVNETLSFEDFEQAIAQRPASDVALDELVRERLTAEKDAQKKERELKKARNKLS